MPLTKEDRSNRAIVHVAMLSCTITWSIMFSLVALALFFVIGYIPEDLFVLLLFVAGFGFLTVLVESISSWGPYDGL